MALARRDPQRVLLHVGGFDADEAFPVIGGHLGQARSFCGPRVPDDGGANGFGDQRDAARKGWRVQFDAIRYPLEDAIGFGAEVDRRAVIPGPFGRRCVLLAGDVL